MRYKRKKDGQPAKIKKTRTQRRLGLETTTTGTICEHYTRYWCMDSRSAAPAADRDEFELRLRGILTHSFGGPDRENRGQHIFFTGLKLKVTRHDSAPSTTATTTTITTSTATGTRRIVSIIVIAEIGFFSAVTRRHSEQSFRFFPVTD